MATKIDTILLQLVYTFRTKNIIDEHKISNLVKTYDPNANIEVAVILRNLLRNDNFITECKASNPNLLKIKAVIRKTVFDVYPEYSRSIAQL